MGVGRSSARVVRIIAGVTIRRYWIRWCDWNPFPQILRHNWGDLSSPQCKQHSVHVFLHGVRSERRGDPGEGPSWGQREIHLQIVTFRRQKLQ